MVVQNDSSSIFSSSDQDGTTSFACDIQSGPNKTVLKHQQHFDFGLSEDDMPAMERWSNTFNMRSLTLCSLAGETSLRSMASRTYNPRVRSRSVMTAGKSLDLLRQNLQATMNRDIDAVIQGYLEKYFCPAVRNIRVNLGRSSVTSDTVRDVVCSILEEAKLFYVAGGGRLTSLGCKSEEGSSLQDSFRKRKSTDHAYQHSKRSRGEVSNKVPLSKLDPLRIDSTSLFMLASRAQKVLGLRSSGYSVRLPLELFRYRTDKEDRDWLIGRKLLRSSLSSSNSQATYSSVSSRSTCSSDVAVNLVLVEDVKELATLDEYKSNLVLNELRGFQVPEFLLVKVQNYMTETANSRNQVQELSCLPLSINTCTSDSSNGSLSNLFETNTSKGQQTSLSDEWPTSDDLELTTRQPTTTTVHHIVFQTDISTQQSIQNQLSQQSFQGNLPRQNISSQPSIQTQQGVQTNFPQQAIQIIPSQSIKSISTQENIQHNQRQQTIKIIPAQSMQRISTQQNIQTTQTARNIQVLAQRTPIVSVADQAVSTMNSESIAQDIHLQDTMNEFTRNLAGADMTSLESGGIVQDTALSDGENIILSPHTVADFSETLESLDKENDALNSENQNIPEISARPDGEDVLDSVSIEGLAELSECIDTASEESAGQEHNTNQGAHESTTNVANTEASTTFSQSTILVSQSLVDSMAQRGDPSSSVPQSGQLDGIGQIQSPDHTMTLAESHSTLTALLNSQ